LIEEDSEEEEEEEDMTRGERRTRGEESELDE